ncbi:hypothetical protein [Streptomyces malaysiense]|uniref:hypothetical protein n=1 Tax=Streptomyces malaysiense TaxID=1428626 RepID=UPI000AE853BD|nr:hypothetical protein [Streptomyces malaysiense]
MGGLIRSMPAAGYPRDWSRGMNLRNDVCQGLVDTPPEHRVALIHAHGHRTIAPPTP